MTVRYTHSVAHSAATLAKWLKASASPTSKVDWERDTSTCLRNSQITQLEETFRPWLRLYFGVEKGLIHWAADPSVTAAVVVPRLQLFSRTVTQLLDAANFLRETCKLIEFYGFHPDGPNADRGGIDVYTAIGTVAGRDMIPPTLRLFITEALLDSVGREFSSRSLVEWCDVPGRSEKDVLRLLSTCADELETV